jgi:hypothetical protein
MQGTFTVVLLEGLGGDCFAGAFFLVPEAPPLWTVPLVMNRSMKMDDQVSASAYSADSMERRHSE